MKYELIRTKRKTLSVQVTSENKIIVRCPQKLPIVKIEEFLESRQSWIKKVCDGNAKKLSDNSSVINYSEIYVYGKRVPLVISDKNAVTDNAVYVKNLSQIKKTYIAAFSESFVEYAQKLAEIIGVHALNYSFRAYRGRWGCCDRNGKITFNYLLFMLPKELQRYVIVHELCHTVYFNHSRLFWQLVGRFVPDYKDLRKELKNFDFLTHLY